MLVGGSQLFGGAALARQRSLFLSRVYLLIIFLMTLTWSGGRASAITVCIDPGHGGTDVGAVGCGLQEAEMNLDVGARLRDMLLVSGIDVIMTRDTDVFIPLASRTAFANANGVDYFMSVHHNSSNPVATGLETFCYSGANSDAFDLRDKIQEEMVLAWPLKDRGGKTASFYVVKYTNMPSTLSELGFINNCGIDATYISDSDERRNAALAHLFALQRHLGLPVQIPRPSTAPPGVAVGVVFEDVGQGIANMTTRLAGAKVEVLETGDRMAALSDGSWLFDLAAGAYTLRASYPGYVDGWRRCYVAAGYYGWCSIGLEKGSPQSLPPPPGRDGGAPVNDAAHTVEDGEPPLGQGPTSDDQGCSCRIGGSSPATGGLIVGLGLLLLACTRKRRLMALMLMVIGVTLAFSAVAERALIPQQVRSLAHLEGIRQVAAGEYQAPVMAPSGEHLVCTGPKLAGLYLVSTKDKTIKRITAQDRAGYLPVWRSDSRAIGLRTHGRAFSSEPLRALDLAGKRQKSFAPVSGLGVIQHNDCITLETRDRAISVACGHDRYYAPQLSPDRRHLVYNGLATGLFLYRISDGRTIALGSGHQPSFSGDGKKMVFSRTKDNGQELTEADIWITDLGHPSYRSSALTRTPDTLEQYPSLSRDGKLISYSAEGNIYVASVVY